MHARRPLSCALFLLCWAGFHSHNAVVGDDFERDVLPILKSHCVRCHGPELQESNIRLDTLSTDLINDRAATENWHEVLNALDSGAMPPEGEPQLSVQQLEVLTTWVSANVKQAIDARRRTDGRVVIRRLNRREYQNTMRDLFGLEMDYTRDLPPDAISSDGFLNDGRSLQMTSLQLEIYLATARRALERVIVSGEAPEPFHHTFTASNVGNWLGNLEISNRLGRQQQFLAKMVDDYPDDGEFLVRVQVTADLKPNVGFPLLEVSVGYRPDTQILFRELDIVELTDPGPHSLEFRGRLENFPLPVRGQGKYPGLVVRVRNLYDDQSPRPKAQKTEKKKSYYEDESHLPTLTIESVEFHGNAYQQWPPTTHRRILFESPRIDREDRGYIAEVLERFMTRAFRRAIDDSEVAGMIEFYESIRPEFPSFEEAVRETLAMVLIQPDFLFRIEPAGDEKRSINDVELATRLAYFLWSTMPDNQLLELAFSETLRRPETLVSEVDRLLDDPRSQQFVEQFIDQWLGLQGIDNVAVSRDRFPGFDDSLKQHMCGETRSLFAELLREDLSAIHLLHSDFTMLNEPLAKHYGIDGVYGQSFQRVTLDPQDRRGGLLSHAGILLSNSTGADSHPVRRAVWIRDRLLNDPPAPPPPNVPSLEEADPKFHELSVREQLEIHRTNESCNRCHRNIDPWGIALENYDAVGNWRTEITRKQGGKPRQIAVNATDVLPDGHEVAGAEALKIHLANERRQDFATSLVSRMLTYALGRSLELSDQEAVKDLSRQFAADDFRLKSLIHRIAASEIFQTK